MPDEPSLPPARFAALADIYGADRRRWPAAERLAAAACPAGDAILAKAGAVDRFLDGYAVATPSAAMIGQILASAHYPRRLRSRAQLWWSGIGLAGIGFAGALAGSLAVSITVPATYHHGLAFADEQATAFDNADVEGTDL